MVQPRGAWFAGGLLLATPACVASDDVEPLEYPAQEGSTTDVARTEGFIRLRAGVRPDSLVDLGPLRGIPAESSPLEIARLVRSGQGVNRDLARADELPRNACHGGGGAMCRAASARVPAMRLTAAITHEGERYVARCFEVEVASHGETIESALANLREALELRFQDEPATTLRPEPPMIASIDPAPEAHPPAAWAVAPLLLNSPRGRYARSSSKRT